MQLNSKTSVVWQPVSATESGPSCFPVDKIFHCKTINWEQAMPVLSGNESRMPHWESLNWCKTQADANWWRCHYSVSWYQLSGWLTQLLVFDNHDHASVDVTYYNYRSQLGLEKNAASSQTNLTICVCNTMKGWVPSKYLFAIFFMKALSAYYDLRGKVPTQ